MGFSDEIGWIFVAKNKQNVKPDKEVTAKLWSECNTFLWCSDICTIEAYQGTALGLRP